MSATAFNQRTIDEFHSKLGRGIGGWGDNLLLMTSTGALSGQAITTPLVYRKRDDDYIVVASKGGAPADPKWLSNIRTNRAVTIEVAAGDGTEAFQATAAVVSDEAERQALYEFMTVVWPQFADYAKRAARTIPVVILTRSST